MKPRRRETYWTLDRYFQPRMHIWYGNRWEEKHWEIGNVFASRREASDTAKKIQQLLKQDKEPIPQGTNADTSS